MPTYLQSILNDDPAVIEFDCLEFSHPDFSQPFCFVRNAVKGITVTHEDATTHDYVYAPLTIKNTNSTDDLDQTLNISVGDIKGSIAQVMNPIAYGNNWNIRVTVIRRIYLSTDLTAPVLSLPALEVYSYKRDAMGNALFDAKAAELNSNKTGETYTLERFPLLRALL